MRIVSSHSTKNKPDKGHLVEVSTGNLLRDIAHDYGGFDKVASDVEILDAAIIDSETIALHVEVDDEPKWICDECGDIRRLDDEALERHYQEGHGE